MIEEQGGVRITGSETAQEIKKLSKASGIPERELAQEVEKQAFKQEVATSLFKKQAEKREVPEWVKERAVKSFEDNPTARRVTIETSEGSYTFERGETKKSYSGSGAVWGSAESFKQSSIKEQAELQAERPDLKNLKYWELYAKEQRGKTYGGLASAGYSIIIGASKSTSQIIQHPIKEGARLGAYTLLATYTGGAGVVAGAFGETLFIPGKREALAYEIKNNPYFVTETIGGAVPYVVIGGLVTAGIKGVKAGIKQIKGVKTQQYTTTYEPVKLEIGKTSVTQKIKTDLKPGQLTEYQRGYLGYTYGERAPSVTVGSIKQSTGIKGRIVGLDKTQYLSLQTKKYYIQATSKPGLRIDNTAKVSYPGYITKIKYISKSTGKIVSTKSVFTKEGLKPELEGSIKSKSIEGVNWKKLLKTDQAEYKTGIDVKGGRFKQTSTEIKQLSVQKTRQLDTATNYELKSTKYNLKGEPNIYYEIKQPEIIYSKAPTYKSNILKIEPGQDFITVTSIKEPTLVTVVKTTGKTNTYYVSETGLKPIGKKAELLLGSTTQRIEKINVLTPDKSTKIKTDVGLVSPELLGEVTKGIPKTEIVALSIPSVDYKSKVQQTIKPTLRTDVRLISEPKKIPDNILETKPLTDTKPKTETISSINTKTKIETIESPEISETIEVTTPKTKTPFQFLKVPTPQTPPPVAPGNYLEDFEMFETPKKFSVLARRRGQFKEIAQAETIQEAFTKGSFFVDTTSSASFKIEPLGFDFDVGGQAKALLPETFRESKREPGVYVEKRAFRISTPGEKKEITELGLLSLQTKKQFWRL